jgi:hypothetical protein
MKSKRVLKVFIMLAAVSGLMWIQSCLTAKQESGSQQIIITNPEGKGFIFELDFQKGKSHHYPLMAAWVEDIQGNYLQTLYVARSVAKGEYDHADASTGKWSSGTLIRPATLPYWAHKYNTIAKNTETYPSPQHPVPDVYSGATPTGNFTLNSRSDKPLTAPFRVWFEINQFFDFNHFWTNSSYPEDKEYKTSGQPALIYASDIIYPGSLPSELNLRLIGHSHYSGQDGGLYTSLETITSAKNIVSTISIKIRK